MDRRAGPPPDGDSHARQIFSLADLYGCLLQFGIRPPCPAYRTAITCLWLLPISSSREPASTTCGTSTCVLPRNQLICFTGVSGSGKSSLAFDTLYAEGQRRYVESLSSFARQFLGQMPKPDVDLICGLSPAISISQKSGGQNPRSTVGTITEIYDYLRVLLRPGGQGALPAVRPADHRPDARADHRAHLAAAGRHAVLGAGAADPRPEGRIPRPVRRPAEAGLRPRPGRWPGGAADRRSAARPADAAQHRSGDRSAGGRPSSRARLAEAVELALRLGEGNLIVARSNRAARKPRRQRRPESRKRRKKSEPDDVPADEVRPKPAAADDLQLSAHYACTHCSLSFEPPSPQLFSFNSPQGMCPECDGLGEIYTLRSRAAGSRPEPFVPAGLHRAGRPVARDGPLAAAHLSAAWPKRSSASTGCRRARCSKRPGRSSTRSCNTLCSGAPATSTSRSPGGAARRATSRAASSRASSPSCSRKYRTTQQPHAAPAAGKVHARHRLRATATGQRLNPQARAVTLTTRHPKFADRPARSLPEVCALAGQRRRGVLQRVGAGRHAAR